MPDPFLSVIIPAYNEEKRIHTILDACLSFLPSQEYTYEIIVVDDGSTDQTAAIAEQYAADGAPLRVVALCQNQGKGGAVKAGMAEANGQYHLFADADNSTAFFQVEKLLAAAHAGADVAIGSRATHGAHIAKPQSPFRQSLGRLGNRCIQSLVLPGIQDTQCGFKLFSKKASAALFPQLQATGWSFDIELLVRARKHGFAITEVPVEWCNDTASHVRFADYLRVYKDLFRIRKLRK